jgi:hypothetical protein
MRLEEIKGTKQVHSGRAMAQTLSRRSPTAETGVLAVQSMRDLCWTKWHWNRLLSEFFCFSLSVSFHLGSMLIYHLGENNRSVSGRSS